MVHLSGNADLPPGTWALGKVEGLGDDEGSGQKLSGRTQSCKHQARAQISEADWAADRDGPLGRADHTHSRGGIRGRCRQPWSLRLCLPHFPFTLSPFPSISANMFFSSGFSLSLFQEPSLLQMFPRNFLSLFTIL